MSVCVTVCVCVGGGGGGGLMRSIVIYLVSLFTYSLCVVFQGELQGRMGMVPSNFTGILPNAIIVEGD